MADPPMLPVPRSPRRSRVRSYGKEIVHALEASEAAATGQTALDPSSQEAYFPQWNFGEFALMRGAKVR